ncbi:hypothetical protein [Sphingopyxis flava]|uniref:Uncharacterized protein n=1 Tax=Sphingopyxis flava TaxID=1507287 RepID=A0A1T5A2G9_9SPHN|nr:hypothetical protein [Sphingopyxis flava]SKB28957.1 hypothetical protein SAMN06295937_1002110 [Sphingopyxis flava]
MSAALALALALSAPASLPGPVFECSFGAKQLRVTQEKDALVYRYGTKARTELRIAADAKSGRVFYHRTLYPRGEDQTLRFVNGDFSYVVFAHWTAPPSNDIDFDVPAAQYGGLIVMRGDAIISTRICKQGGDMVEWPIFKTLPTDADNLTPPI